MEGGVFSSKDIEEVILHPEYNQFLNNIALIKFKSRIVSNAEVGFAEFLQTGPIALNTKVELSKF